MKKVLQAVVIVVGVIIAVLLLRLGYYAIIHKAEDIKPKARVFRQQSVSGVFPHLAVFNEQHIEEKAGETGIGAVVPWGNKLYAITYSAHKPRGSADKLYVIDKKLKIKESQLSVGGTPANRMIHKESRQLIIGPYFIKENGDVRVVPPDEMPGRLTATARHLTDPAHKVYFYTMEEGLYEEDVYSLEGTQIYEDGNMLNPPDVAGPLLPGYHGKGAYTAQNRLIVANNGEYKWQIIPESGSLSEWDGENWKVIERKQFTEVTGPGGLYGNESIDDPVWSTGWDEKSIILKLRENGDWYTYRMPKASFTYDGRHGWHTEWPRIRDIGEQDWLMTMHGMFWAFPPDFSLKNNSGIRPLSSYLKIIPDFTPWQGYIVMGCDDASSFDNALVGQPQSNLWFVKPDQLNDFGPGNGFGGVWLNEDVKAYSSSDPFLAGGFDRVMVFIDGTDQEDFTLSIERQQPDNNNWEVWHTVEMKANEVSTPVYHLVGNTEWIRFSADKDLKGFTIHMHLTQSDPQTADPQVFRSMSHIGASTIKSGWLRPDARDGKLQIFGSKTVRYYTLDEKLDFDYTLHDEESITLRENLIPKRGAISFDEASVIYTDQNDMHWRLPWGPGGLEKWYTRYPQRRIREVVTERSLLNAGGIFYELPRDISGGIKRIKPISTHNRMITDFCSWRGIMVMTGTQPEAIGDEHYHFDSSLGIGLWLGTIDDLWKFGKPTGMGGPWNHTAVSAGETSDPYLMLGFDKKTLFLSHNSPETVSFDLMLDFTGEGQFVLYKKIDVLSGEGTTIEFEDGFSAHWIKLRVDKVCKASAWLVFE